MKIVLSISFLLFYCQLSLVQAQETKRVFFVGNSYTHYNNMPTLLSNLALSLGDTVIHASSTPGGMQFVQHVSNNTTLNGIRQGNWDVVVLQEQSQKPSFSDAQVATDVYPYAAQLSDSIKKYNPCAETAFFMTWGRKNGDAQNCAFLPALCTFDGMNARLRRAYLRMAVDNEGIAAPVGAVWKAVRDSFPTLELYRADESHPSVAGSYLIACTFYASFFRKAVTGASYRGSLSALDAQRIQQLVDMVVLDSLPNWHIGSQDVQASFAAVINGSSVSFSNNSQQATHMLWRFGDVSPLDTTSNPTHSYNNSGTYTVTLIASDSCGNSDTSSQSITIATVINTTLLEKEPITVKLYPNPSQGQFTIHCETGIRELRIINMLGQNLLYLENLGKEAHHIKLDGADFQGIHYVLIRDDEGRELIEQLAIY